MKVWNSSPAGFTTTVLSSGLSDIASIIQTYVAGAGVTLAPGTYEVHGCIMAHTASTTGGSRIEIRSSTTLGVGTLFAAWGAYIDTNYTAPALFFENYINSWFNGPYGALASNPIAYIKGDAPNHGCAMTVNGTLVLTGNTTISFGAFQNSAVDAVNPAYLAAGSALYFTKVA